MEDLISDATVEVINTAELILFHRNGYYPSRFYLERKINTRSSLQNVRARLIALNQFIAEHDLEQHETGFEFGENLDWLFYEHEIEVVPIYQEAVALVERLQIIPLSRIQNFLVFMKIPGSRTAVDPENHGNGYHFHYGEVRRDVLVRYDVLLTFDKAKSETDSAIISETPLYIEPHGVGKYVHIDASTIGHNRRLPVYLVCDKIMRKRGIQNFMSPSNDSWQFYPLA